MRTPATAPTTAASTQAPAYTRSTLMPISRAAVWFCATARMARPKRVARKSATRASIRTSEAPMTPRETGATRTGPSARGRFENSAGNGSSSLVHTTPAAARRTSESPRVMISTSQWVAERARRMITRSTRNARSPPAATPQASAASSGSPAVCCADQATNAETMSISPWAKFTVRVAL